MLSTYTLYECVYLSTCTHTYIYIYICMCVCAYTHIHIPLYYKHVYIYIYANVPPEVSFSDSHGHTFSPACSYGHTFSTQYFLRFPKSIVFITHVPTLRACWVSNSKPSFYCAFLLFLIQKPTQTFILLRLLLLLIQKPIQTFISPRFFIFFDPKPIQTFILLHFFAFF